MTKVWESKLDKRYQCEVVRISKPGVREGYAGKLTITDERHDNVVFEQEVGLAYGAIFGPDSDDVRTWEEMCVAIIDGTGTAFLRG